VPKRYWCPWGLTDVKTESHLVEAGVARRRPDRPQALSWLEPRDSEAGLVLAGRAASIRMTYSRPGWLREDQSYAGSNLGLEGRAD
jgi:hypothetical protein